MKKMTSVPNLNILSQKLANLPLNLSLYMNFNKQIKKPFIYYFTKKEKIIKSGEESPFPKKSCMSISKRLPQLRFFSWLASRLVSVAALYGKRHAAAARACHHRGARLATRNMKEAIKDSN